ncbi:MAG: glucose 1-dehydrogenase [Myxococcota bacterium]
MLLDRFRLEDKVVVVTGGGRGIGRGIALGFGEAGAKVVVAARRRHTLDEVVSALAERGADGLAVPTDVNEPEALDALVAQTLERFGHIDILVNNAGGTPPLIALQTSDETFAQAFHFNVTTAFSLSRRVIPHLLERGGCILNISSAMSHLVDSGFVSYGTAKAALNHLTRLLAAEFAPKVRVNALAVGAVVTDALEAVTQMASLREAMIDKTPMSRLGTVDDVAAVALLLCSDAGSWVTGKVYEVDGGAVDSTWPMKIPGY